MSAIPEVFKQLAERLDQLPNGYPKTDSGVELKILQKLFTEEEASVAARMSEVPTDSPSIADQLDQNERSVYGLLKSMLKKGLIELEKADGKLKFYLIPFVVGFYENQNANIDAEFAALFESYYHECFKNVMVPSPPLHRVLPVNHTLPVNIDILPSESAHEYVKQARAWGVLNCICRVQKNLIGEGCHHSVKNCLAFSKREGAFDRHAYIEAIDMTDALKLLETAADEGLVHTTKNIKDGVSYICNCCTCSCGILRGIKEYGIMSSVGKSHYIAEIDNTACIGCGMCVEWCQFKALRMDQATCNVDSGNCYGCGICIDKCPSSAIRLFEKEQGKKEEIPDNIKQWGEKRNKSR